MPSALRLRATACWCAAILAACGGDGGNGPDETPALAVAEVSPEDGAEDAESGAPVTVTFNRSVDPSTVNPQSFVLRAGGTPLITGVTYDASARTARLVGPLLPGSLYQVELTTGITDDDGGALSAAEQWSFDTRTWEGVSLDPVGAGERFGSLLGDGSGRLHLAYLDVADEDLEYATCAADCTSPANWTRATVDATGNVGHFPALAMDGGGGLHLVYFDGSNTGLKYAGCTDACDTAEGWTSAVVDTAEIVGLYASLAVAADGRLHAGYHKLSNSEVRYATCGGDCTTTDNWTVTVVDQAPSDDTAIGVDGTGRLHLSYRATGNLGYATCGAACTTGANWTVLPLDDVGGGHPSLLVDASGAVHLSYRRGSDPNGDLAYATCPEQCGTEANWSLLPVDSTGNVGQYSSLALSADGRRHVSYYDVTNGDLKYATCAADCLAAESWQSAAVDQAGDVGAYTSLVVDAVGRVHLSYQDVTGEDLKYIE